MIELDHIYNMDCLEGMTHIPDGKLLAWRHAMMCCINPADDIKLDSTLKALAKDRTISARILDRLKANSEIV